MVSLVVAGAFVAITAAGLVHRRFGSKRATLVLLVAVVAVGVTASVVAAGLRATSCPCG
jgi:hypothetical protein